MLQHIALTVNDSEEIENFFKEVLLFNLKHKFSMKEEITHQIFDIEGSTDVYVMGHDDTVLEIFISPMKETKVFSHVCFAFSNAETIYKKASDLGYKTFIKENPNSNTYFIWDRSGNMFEIKEITLQK
jgi:catechol 2,3-dioxygenase-like lactoylglutathione lyase family enzyme